MPDEGRGKLIHSREELKKYEKHMYFHVPDLWRIFPCRLQFCWTVHVREQYGQVLELKWCQHGCLSSICIFSSANCLFMSFTHFPVGKFILLICKSSFHIKVFTLNLSYVLRIVYSFFSFSFTYVFNLTFMWSNVLVAFPFLTPGFWVFLARPSQPQDCTHGNIGSILFLYGSHFPHWSLWSTWNLFLCKW